VCVIGEVGSGKSSLLSAICGELLAFNPDFYKDFKDRSLDEELKKNIMQDSQDVLDQALAPIALSESTALVQ